MDNHKKKLSIKDIAAISGVSIATVSRVLNNKGGYSKETEEKMDYLVDEYESMQTFTELEDGSFEMVTGNTYDEVSDWIRHKAIWWI